jgi:hypothetical protein
MSTVHESGSVVLESIAKIIMSHYYQTYSRTDTGNLALQQVKIENYKGSNGIRYAADKIFWMTRQHVTKIIQKHLGENTKVSHINIQPSVKYINSSIPLCFSYASASLPEPLVEYYTLFLSTLLKLRSKTVQQAFANGDLAKPPVNNRGFYTGMFRDLFNRKFAIHSSTLQVFSNSFAILAGYKDKFRQLWKAKSISGPNASIVNENIEVSPAYKSTYESNLCLLHHLLALDYRLASSGETCPSIYQDCCNNLILLSVYQTVLGSTGTFYNYDSSLSNETLLNIKESKTFIQKDLAINNLIAGLKEANNTFRSLIDSHPDFERVFTIMGNNKFQDKENFVRVFEQRTMNIQNYLNVYGISNNFEENNELNSFATFWLTDSSLPQELSRLNSLSFDSSLQIASFFGSKAQNFFNAGNFFQKFMQADHSEMIFGGDVFENDHVNTDIVAKWVRENLKLTVMYIDPNYIAMRKSADLMANENINMDSKLFTTYSLLCGTLGKNPEVVSQNMGESLNNLDHMLCPFDNGIIDQLSSILRDKLNLLETFHFGENT